MKRIAGAVMFAALCAPSIVSAAVQITEIDYDPQGSDGKHEWIEIFNDGPDAVDLSKIKFTDGSNHVLNAPPKNGGIGTMSLAVGAYAIIASDGTTFRTVYPGVSEVIDTTMSLKNDAGTVALTGTQGAIASASYSSALGASGDSDSLQWSGGSWIHAAPTPGAANASQSSVHQKPSAPVKTTITKTKTLAAKSAAPKTSAKTKPTAQENDANDPMPLVNASPEESPASQVAAVGMLGASAWWIAAAAFAILVGVAASVISRQKKGEWDIVEEN